MLMKCLNFLVNADECLMTRLQEMSLDYHFNVEQEVGSSTCQFFGFNGKPEIHLLIQYNSSQTKSMQGHTVKVMVLWFQVLPVFGGSKQ